MAGRSLWMSPASVVAAGALALSCGSGDASSNGPGGSTPVVASCGDGTTQDPEACDDGASNGTYGKCRVDCSGVARCGDGAVDSAQEACDDGALNGTYGKCRADCKGVSSCGDNVVDSPTEICDEGSAMAGEYGTCRANCSGLIRCGDDELDAPQENCDEGADNGKYGHCRTDCSADSRCGDGILDVPDEACDDGAANGKYGGCTTKCARPAFPYAPGPGVLDPAWLASPPACNEHDWTGKYLNYRLRFRGDGTAAHPGFISLGSDTGQSIPASRREPDIDCAGHWSMESCPRPDLADAKGRYAWGDATIWLGMYLEAIATEYAGFQQLGLDTSQTAQDLAYALHALDRVDGAAEAVFGKPAALDGFFLRDDVPVDMHLLPGGGYRFPRSDNGLLGYECVISSDSCGTPTVAGGSFTSQDQVIGLVHGLALVSKLVPDSVTVQGVGIRQQARQQVHRMVTHLRSHGWQVTAPDGSHPPDQWGGNASGFSWLLAGAANQICGADFGVSEYQDAISTSIGKTTLQLLESGWDLTMNYNRTMALRLLAITNDWDDDKYALRAVADGKDAFVLARAVLQGSPLPASFSSWRIESILDSAPCSGPCFHTTGCDDPAGWGAEHRTSNPGDRFGSRHWSGEFNGLDYMALHNLALVQRGGSLGMAVPDVPATCSGFRSIDQILANPSTQGESYDPSDPCAREDLKRQFCGRPLAGWIDAAYREQAGIQTAFLHWTCTGSSPCQLVPLSGIGTDLDDLILGGPGGETLEGVEGNDCLYGFGGADHLVGGAGDDELHGGLGNDTIEGDSPSMSGIDRLFGDEGNDTLVAGPGADELLGGDNDDLMQAGDGRDLGQAGPGNDRFEGGAGDDTAQGGPGDDAMIGGEGDDTFWCGDGRDKVSGGNGDDWVWGDGGEDLLLGEGGNDNLIGGDGIDHLCGGDSDDTLWGNWAGSMCWGGAGTNQVNGCTDGSLNDAQCSASAFASW